MERPDRSSIWIALTSVAIAALVGALLGILGSFASSAMDQLGFVPAALVVGGCLFIAFLLANFSPTGASQSKLVRVAIIVAVIVGYVVVGNTFGPGGWHKP